MRNIALVMAAGCGTRFKGSLSDSAKAPSDKPKQFVKIGGREILARAIHGLEREPGIDAILVVVERKYIKFTQREIVKKYGFKKVIDVIAGGAQRYNSVYNALCYLEKAKPENVVIHDGARPVFDAKALKTVLASLKTEVAVIPVTRITSTVKQVKRGYVTCTVDRDCLRASVTPQGYKYADLFSLYSAKAIMRLKPTDEAFVFENVGFRVKVVEHEGPNIKVTTKEDLQAVEAILRLKS